MFAAIVKRVVQEGVVSKKAKEKVVYQIPFDNDGNMLNYVHKHPGPWQDIKEFQTAFTAVRVHRGRSSVAVEVKDLHQRSYWISLKEFMRLVFSHTLDKGKLPPLWWTYKKHGFSYFIYEVRLDPSTKQTIDNMSQTEMAKMWRFASLGEPMFLGAVGTYFSDSFAKKGGMTPAVSKAIGWGDSAVDSDNYRRDKCLAILGSDVTGEYRCGRPATSHTSSEFWTTAGIDQHLTPKQQKEQPVCLEHARQVDRHYSRTAEVKDGRFHCARIVLEEKTNGK
jgi:hypothetical protein